MVHNITWVIMSIQKKTFSSVCSGRKMRGPFQKHKGLRKRVKWKRNKSGCFVWRRNGPSERNVQLLFDEAIDSFEAFIFLLFVWKWVCLNYEPVLVSTITTRTVTKGWRFACPQSNLFMKMNGQSADKDYGKRGSCMALSTFFFLLFWTLVQCRQPVT